MTQYVINIGAIPNDGTGDPLRTAFNETNLNFNQVFAAGPVLSNIQIANNSILTINTNGNLVLNPNGIGVVQANAHVVPDQTRIRNLGSPTRYWDTTYTQYLQAVNANIGSATINDANLGNVGTMEINVDNLHISGGSNGYVLQTDGTGNLTWTAQTGGSGHGTPGGANTQVQFNDAGSFGGHPGFIFNKTTDQLSVPGDINLTDGTVIQSSGGIQFPSSSSEWDLHSSDGNIYIGALPTEVAYIDTYSPNISVRLRTNEVNDWIFDPSGNLTLPNIASPSINYANGSPYGGGSANTGNVTFNDQAVIGTGSQYGDSGLYLAPGTESVGNLQYLRVRGGDYPTHIHLDTGNNQYFDQYFGDDYKYVKLSNAGNIVINSNDNAGNTAQWNFGTDGVLTTPGASGNITGANVISATTFAIAGSSTELGQIEGANTVGFYTSDNALQYLFEGPNNVTWGFNVGTGGTGFPTLNVQRGDNPSGTIQGQTLLFGDNTKEAIISTPDGNVSYPDSQRLVINPGAGAPGTSGEGGDIYLWAGRGGDVDGNGGDIKIRGGQGMGNGPGGYLRIEAGDTQGNGDPGYIQITGGQGGNTYGGYVDITGGYGATVGGDVKLYGGYGQATGGNVNIWGGASGNGQANEGHVNIETGGNTWTFAADGNLTTPANGIIKPVSDDLTLDASGGNVYVKSKGHTFLFDANGVGRFVMPNNGKIAADSNLSINVGDWANSLGSLWTFGVDGEFYLPTGGRIGATKGGTMLDGGAGNSVSLTSFYGNGYYAGCFTANPDGNVSITTYTGTGVAGSWQFDNTGNLTTSGNIITSGPTGNITGANVVSANTFTSPGNVVINSDDNTWTFGTDGNLNLPGGYASLGISNSGYLTTLGNDSTSVAIDGDNGVVTLATNGGGTTYTFVDNFNATSSANVLSLTTRNGDSNPVNSRPQIVFGYNGTTDYPQFIHTIHNAGTPVNNRIEFWTSDGTQAGTFPANAILGLTVTNGNIATGGILTDNYYYANGTPVTFSGSSYGNSNVTSLLAGFGSNTISTTGNILAGNASVSGNLSVTGNVIGNVVTTFESTWTVPTGTNTYSFTVGSGTYSMWVTCSIPNGILAWNATATVTNNNVPVVGTQYAWVYNGGGTPIDFTSIPNQFTGTANAIVRSNVAPSATTNKFDFGINNTSGGNVTVRYGWARISQ
jgi:hypothetical protein